MATPLQQLSEAAGTDLPHLFAARELTAAKLAERRPSLQQLQHDEDVAIVLMGSWGRSEVTSGSDDDYMLPVFECARLTAEQMPGYLRAQLGMPPVDQIAEAFLRHGATDPGGRAVAGRR
jgi:Putative nucleotidyltransferase DUF294